MPRLFILIKFEVFKPVVVLHTDLIGDVIVSTNKTVCFKIKESRFKISLLDFFKPTKEPFTSCMNMGNWEEILFYSCLFLPQATFSVTSPHMNVFCCCCFLVRKTLSNIKKNRHDSFGFIRVVINKKGISKVLYYKLLEPNAFATFAKISFREVSNSE